MLPIPPLDGGRVAVGILPAPLALPLARLERVGNFIVIGLFMLAPWLGIPLGQWLILRPALWIQNLIIAATGLG
jgi:Zn-dependent protease